MKPEFTIIYERDEDGWWIANIPEVPGAFSRGRTRKQARENALDALQELMIARRELAISRKSPTSISEPLVFA